MGKFSDDEARPHHYLFAHRILPLLALKHGEKMLEMANDGRLTDALERTWDGAGGKVPPEDRLSHEGLETSVHRLQVADLVLVRLPPASHAPEAHFVAITILSTDKAQGSPAIRPTDQVEATGAIPFTNQIHAGMATNRSRVRESATSHSSSDGSRMINPVPCSVNGPPTGT
jgi:hypothetical protein